MNITIPTTLSDITLGQYQRLLAKGEDVSNEQLIHIFCNISLEQVLEMPMNVYDQALGGVVQALNELDKQPSLTNKVEIKGKTYGFIPNLETITYGENKDLTQYLQKWETMHLVLGSQLFFYNLTKALLNAIPNYLEAQMVEEYKGQMQGQSTKQIGEDMMNCIASLRETLGDLMK